ncbi:MAG: PhzF family phenazine biosynthesis protein [Armatimonadota bacterium]|nr:PhzF family phenazine biosynthesis protein [Armatimonadota bacterium]
MRRYRFVQADVFTSRPFAGNQLAVFLDGRGLTGEEMQAIALEMNFSESTFVLPAEIPGAARRVRIFTTARELPMAGHPTVGTAFVLASQGLLPMAGARTDAILQLGIGPVKVTLEQRDGRVRFVWMSHRSSEFGEVFADRTRLAAALGLEVGDLHPTCPPQVVSTGTPFLFVPLASLAAVQRCAPSAPGLVGLYDGVDPEGAYVFSTETTSPDAQIHARMFVRQKGAVPEDPATGAAAGPLGAYLFRYGMLSKETLRRFVCEQGVEMRRPSQIHIEVDHDGSAVTGLRIGGQVVIVGEGEIFWDG